MLTCSAFDHQRHGGFVFVITWDLQTDGVVSAIKQRCPTPDASIAPSITYSMNGEMVGVLRPGPAAPVISIYDVVSGVYMYDINRGLYGGIPPPNHLDFNNVWTHGESIRFAITHPAPITIREAKFTPRVASTQVDTLSVPADAHDRPWSRIEIAQISPASYRLALFYPGAVNTVLVWDTRDSKLLLRHTDVGSPFRATFSSDGRFFACSSEGSEVYLWKEDSTGYRVYGKLASGIQKPIPLLSPDGESIITFGGAMVRSWHTIHLLHVPSSTAPQHTEGFALDFLSDRPAVAIARRNDNVVVILDLNSGVPRLTIDTGMMVYGLRVIGNLIAVIGNGKVVTWNTLGRSSLCGTKMTPKHSTQTITFHHEPRIEKAAFASVSPDFRRVAILGKGFGEDVLIFDIPTGRHWISAHPKADALWFSPGDEGLWCAQLGEGYRGKCWKLNGYDGFQPCAGKAPQGCPWTPPHGYKVRYDEWILSPDGKQLLMLPPPWQSCAVRRVWNGQFLALLHSTLPEPVILDLEP